MLGFVLSSEIWMYEAALWHFLPLQCFCMSV